MNTRKIFCLVVAVCIILTGNVGAWGDVLIDEEHFPDETFRSYISSNFDKDNDGALSDEEIASATSILVSNRSIASLDGIRNFTALTRLECQNNQLSTLDISELTALTYVDCDNNQLTSLNLEGCTSLTELYCSSNPWTTLDLSGNTALQKISCASDQLQSLDVSGCTSLTSLTCKNHNLLSLNMSGCTSMTSFGYYSSNYSGYKLTSLDVSGCTAMTELICHHNALTSLNVSGCTMLERIECYKNELLTLDISGLTALTYVDCDSNQMTSINIEECTSLKELNCSSNPWTTLDLSGNTALQKISCASDQLQSLDVSGCTSLTSLSCENENLLALNMSGCTSMRSFGDTYSNSYESLTSLDVSGCTSLTTLYCYYDSLTSLKVSGCTVLERIDCSSNKLTVLDVSGLTVLTYLNCDYNQLTALDVSGLSELSSLNCSPQSINISRPNTTNSPQYPYSLNLASLNSSINMDNVSIIKVTGSNNSSIEYYTNDSTIYFASRPTTIIYGYDTEHSGTNTLMEVTINVAEAPEFSIYIDAAKFPDKNFRDYILEFDTDGDGALSLEEIAAVRSMNLAGKGISSLVGIEYFTALISLDCSGNSLTTLNLTQNTLLTELNCSNNGLVSLDVSSLTALVSLDCSSNRLTEFDVSANTNLISLSCYDQSITLSGVSTDGMPAYPYTLNLNNLKDSLGISADIEEFVSRVHSLDILDASGGSVDHRTYTETGIVYFSAQPSAIEYFYDTQFNAPDAYMNVFVAMSDDELPVIPVKTLALSLSPAEQKITQGSLVSINISPENISGTFSWSFRVSGDVNLALTSSDMSITGTIPASTSPGTYTVVITAHDDRATPITSTASIIVEEASAPVTPDKPNTPEEPSEPTKPDTPTSSDPKPAPEDPSTPQMPEQDSPRTPTEEKTDEPTTPQTRTNHYSFTMSAPLRNSILSAFPGLTADDIHQLSDSEIISESWNIGDSDTQELSGMRERAVLNLPAFRPQNSGVYVMMLTLTNADAGAKINLRNISGTDNVSAGSVGEMQYTFFDANGNTTDTVPDDKVIYAAVRLTAGTETRGVITVPTGTASSVMAEGTITPVEPDERESLSEIIAEEMRDVVSLEPSQIRFITEENIIAEAPDPEQSMKEQAKNDGYELVGRLNKIQVKDEGYYVFRVNLSEDLFRQLEGLSIEDIGVYAFTSGTSSVNSSFFFMLNGILNTWEILSVTGKRFHKFDKFGVREFLMIGFLNSSQPFTMYLAKAILSIMTGGLGGGCNAGLGLVSAACAVMFLIHRKER